MLAADPARKDLVCKDVIQALSRRALPDRAHGAARAPGKTG
jgi:hypothetical protein